MDSIRLIFLGTGAAAPTRERNVSSLAVVLDGRTLIFDCGEATQHQIQRSNVHSSSIEAIFITHLHGDHVFGLPGLLATLGLNGRTAPLTICGPRGLHAFISAIPYLGAPYEIDVVEEPTFLNFDSFDVFATRVEHSVDCYAYCIVEHDRAGMFDVERAQALGIPAGPLYHQLQRGRDVTLDSGRVIRPEEVLGSPRSGRRIAFVTDTRPCAAAVELARDADLLVHEATYANDHAADAHNRFHSTSEKAAQVARAANAKLLLLTHISARYDDTTRLCAEAAAIFMPVDVARDLMEVTIPRRRA